MAVWGQSEINRENVCAYWQDFPARWQRMAAQWQAKEDGLWLVSHANYVLHTGFLWAVDLAVRDKQAESWLLSHAAETLKDLRFILLTHMHADHYNLPLLQAIAKTDVRVVVPDFFPADTEKQLAPLRVIRVKTGNSLFLETARIRVLEGAHYDYNRPETGVPAVGYSVTVNGKTLMFPGDVRDYAKHHMDAPADLLLAHVWLGRGCAQKPKEETCFEAYCDWLRRAAPRRALLTHLYDVTRKPCDQWTRAHAKWIGDALSDVPLSAPCLGERIEV